MDRSEVGALEHEEDTSEWIDACDDVPVIGLNVDHSAVRRAVPVRLIEQPGVVQPRRIGRIPGRPEAVDVRDRKREVRRAAAQTGRRALIPGLRYVYSRIRGDDQRIVENAVIRNLVVFEASEQGREGPVVVIAQDLRPDVAYSLSGRASSRTGSDVLEDASDRISALEHRRVVLRGPPELADGPVQLVEDVLGPQQEREEDTSGAIRDEICNRPEVSRPPASESMTDRPVFGGHASGPLSGRMPH